MARTGRRSRHRRSAEVRRTRSLLPGGDLGPRIPALIINDRFDVLAANRLAARLFTGITPAPDVTCNLARYLFLDPGARDFYLEWEEVATATAGQLRLAAGCHPDDRDLTALITSCRPAVRTSARCGPSATSSSGPPAPRVFAIQLWVC